MYQCSLTISEALWHLHQGNFAWDAQDIRHWNEIKMTNLRLKPFPPRLNCLIMSQCWLTELIIHLPILFTCRLKFACRKDSNIQNLYCITQHPSYHEYARSHLQIKHMISTMCWYWCYYVHSVYWFTYPHDWHTRRNVLDTKCPQVELFKCWGLDIPRELCNHQGWWLLCPLCYQFTFSKDIDWVK